MKKIASMFVVAVVVGLLGYVVGGWLWPSGSSSVTPPVALSVRNAVLPGVTQADLTNEGIYSVTTAEGLQASVPFDKAESVAVNHEVRAKVLETQLVQLSNAQYHNLLAWAVSLDPLSGMLIGPTNGNGTLCKLALDGQASFVLTFVDATNGKWLMELQAARVKSLASPPCSTS